MLGGYIKRYLNTRGQMDMNVAQMVPKKYSSTTKSKVKALKKEYSSQSFGSSVVQDVARKPFQPSQLTDQQMAIMSDFSTQQTSMMRSRERTTALTRRERMTQMDHFPALSTGVNTAVPDHRQNARSLNRFGVSSSQIALKAGRKSGEAETMPADEVGLLVPYRDSLISQASATGQRLRKPLQLKMFKTPEFQLTPEQKSIMAEVVKSYKRVDEEFLGLFEKRYVIFIEDGTDLTEELKAGNSPVHHKQKTATSLLPLNTISKSHQRSIDHETSGRTTLPAQARKNRNFAGSQVLGSQKNVTVKPLLLKNGLPPAPKLWTKPQKRIKIDVNKYIAKYDFDIASKICPMKSGVDYNDAYQDFYKQNALMELLQECSNAFTGGSKVYQSLFTFDGKFISSLDEIPADTKIIFVSEREPPYQDLGSEQIPDPFLTGVDLADLKKQEISGAKLKKMKVGLKNNVFEFDNDADQKAYECQEIEKRLTSRKSEWAAANTEHWATTTPAIYGPHKEAIKESLAPRQKPQTFITLKRKRQQLADIQELVSPFITETMGKDIEPKEEPSQELSTFTNVMTRTYSMFSKYPDQMKPRQTNDYFGLHKQSKKSEAPKTTATIANPDEVRLKRIESQIKAIEQRTLDKRSTSQNFSGGAKREVRERKRVFKKPLNTLAVRQDRVNMVKQLLET